MTAIYGNAVASLSQSKSCSKPTTAHSLLVANPATNTHSFLKANTAQFLKAQAEHLLKCPLLLQQLLHPLQPNSGAELPLQGLYRGKSRNEVSAES